MRKRIRSYLKTWQGRGYAQGIPDSVPDELQRLRLAPSYRAICIAILQNDHHMTQLGFTAPVSPWYNAIKRVEIANRVSTNPNDY